VPVISSGGGIAVLLYGMARTEDELEELRKRIEEIAKIPCAIGRGLTVWSFLVFHNMTIWKVQLP
jgi:hypothetical protein